MPLNY